jgi:threonine dehydratase
MLQLIEQASKFLKGKVRKTPLEYSPSLSKILGGPVYLKLEFLQITGSFKLRGAMFYLSTLSEKDKKKGIAACSAGNHGLGCAYAARELGIPCTVFVPKNVDQAKFEKMIQLGANVIKSDYIGYDDTLAWAKKVTEEKGLLLVSAFDDEKIMAGNGGSLAVEILDEIPDATNFILPVGGGGLMGGFSFYIKSERKNSRMIGCQHEQSPALKLSLEKEKAITEIPGIETIAGGIEGGLGEKCFEVLKTRIDEVALASEEEIKNGFRWMLENHQYLIEPTAAVALGCVLSGKIKKPQGPTVIVLTGRNVSYSTIKNLIP